MEKREMRETQVVHVLSGGFRNEQHVEGNFENSYRPTIRST
jgi:hypothetical protein